MSREVAAGTRSGVQGTAGAGPRRSPVCLISCSQSLQERKDGNGLKKNTEAP